MTERFTSINLFAARLDSMVDGTPLDEALKKVNLTQEKILKSWLSPQSSKVVRHYAQQNLRRDFRESIQNPDSRLYLVKKVFCVPEEFEDMEKAIKDMEYNKFQIVKLISWDPKLIDYKTFYQGMEAYLVSDHTELEALEKTDSMVPTISFLSPELFTAREAEKLDEVVENAVYYHTPHFVGELFDKLGW
ncbi:hypothetical protein GOV03_00845 [Candidatus Woesearchaeota archaeon]|nr:hypothetical protein [Candidatus Woesearchaeota archaeon]